MIRRKPLPRSRKPIPKKRAKPRRKGPPAKRNYANGVKIYPGGREVCMATREGIAEYKRRREAMAERQGWICALCGCRMIPASGCWNSATFDHEDGRGMNGFKRDDRIEQFGVPYNFASCQKCNEAHGSKPVKPKFYTAEALCREWGIRL